MLYRLDVVRETTLNPDIKLTRDSLTSVSSFTFTLAALDHHSICSIVGGCKFAYNSVSISMANARSSFVFVGTRMTVLRSRG